MGKQTVILILLYIIIASTLINVLVFGKNKFTDSPKARKFFRASIVAGLVVFSLTLLSYIYIF